MNINFSALNAFRNLNVQNDKSILINTESGVRSLHTYKGPLSAMVRTSGERGLNNQIREQLLDALADAFGMEDQVSVSKGDHNHSVKHYSEAFLNKLAETLGDDFKKADFGFTKDGSVSSGRPLTMRRVTAILNKLENVNFNISAHEKRLAQAQSRMESMDQNSPGFVGKTKMINDATKCLSILKDDAKGEPIVCFMPLIDKYGVRDSAQKNGQLIPADNLNTIEGHVINRLGIPLNLQTSGVSILDETDEDALSAMPSAMPSAEGAHKLNTFVMNAINDYLTQLLNELDKM